MDHLVTIYQVTSQKLDAYNNTQFKYRSFFIALVAAYAAIIQFTVSRMYHVELLFTVVALISALSLFALSMIARFDLLFQDLIECTVKSCEEIEDKLHKEAKFDFKLAFQNKRDDIGAFKMNWLIAWFYILTLFLFLASNVLSTYFLAVGVSTEFKDKMLSALCLNNLATSGDLEFLEANIVDCRKRLSVQTTAKFNSAFLVLVSFASLVVYLLMVGNIAKRSLSYAWKTILARFKNQKKRENSP